MGGRRRSLRLSHSLEYTAHFPSCQSISHIFRNNRPQEWGLRHGWEVVPGNNSRIIAGYNSSSTNIRRAPGASPLAHSFSPPPCCLPSGRLAVEGQLGWEHESERAGDGIGTRAACSARSQRYVICLRNHCYGSHCRGRGCSGNYHVVGWRAALCNRCANRRQAGRRIVGRMD